MYISIKLNKVIHICFHECQGYLKLISFAIKDYAFRIKYPCFDSSCIFRSEIKTLFRHSSVHIFSFTDWSVTNIIIPKNYKG